MGASLAHGGVPTQGVLTRGPAAATVAAVAVVVTN